MRTLLFALAVSVAAPAFADDPPPVYRTATVFGDDPCPKAVGSEIVVCGRLPESERYRIPKALRKQRDESSAGAAWGARVENLEAAQRFTRPGSCTAVGSFGQSGCTQAMIRQWFLERRAKAAAEAGIP
jgi:hypothetical protein